MFGLKTQTSSRNICQLYSEKKSVQNSKSFRRCFCSELRLCNFLVAQKPECLSHKDFFQGEKLGILFSNHKLVLNYNLF